MTGFWRTRLMTLMQPPGNMHSGGNQSEVEH